MKRPTMLFAVVPSALLLVSCQSNVEAPAPTAPSYSWIELGPNGVVLARAIIPASLSACPNIEIDGSSQPMNARSQAPPGFDEVQVCQYTIPAAAASASIASQALSLPSADPQRIVVLGDTGCRIKGSDVQDCDDPQGWKFEQVARDIAAADPDLIIHVGDYHYREGDGTQQLATCPDTKIGLCWASWEADFFAPARALLPTAPWVFVRGNHEDCGSAGSSSDTPRAWRGWFYFLDPRPIADSSWDQADCAAYTDPYLIPAGSMNLLVMDTSEIPDDYAATPVKKDVDRYGHEFTMIEALLQNQDDVWLTTHRPFWAVASWSTGGNAQIGATDLTLQAALAQSREHGIPSSVDMLLAGHVHLFERLVFSDGRPPQFVFGGGGTKLDPPITDALLNANPSVLQSLEAAPKDFTTLQDIDYGIIESTASGWSVTVRNVDGSVDATFSVSN